MPTCVKCCTYRASCRGSLVHCARGPRLHRQTLSQPTGPLSHFPSIRPTTGAFANSIKTTSTKHSIIISTSFRLEACATTMEDFRAHRSCKLLDANRPPDKTSVSWCSGQQQAGRKFSARLIAHSETCEPKRRYGRLVPISALMGHHWSKFGQVHCLKSNCRRNLPVERRNGGTLRLLAWAEGLCPESWVSDAMNSHYLADMLTGLRRDRPFLQPADLLPVENLGRSCKCRL